MHTDSGQSRGHEVPTLSDLMQTEKIQTIKTVTNHLQLDREMTQGKLFNIQ